MSTLQEIKAAIAGLNERDKTLLAAELFAEQAPTPDSGRLAVSLERGLQDLEAGRVRPIEIAVAEVDETEYLLRSPTNHEKLLAAVADVEAGHNVVER